MPGAVLCRVPRRAGLALPLPIRAIEDHAVKADPTALEEHSDPAVADLCPPEPIDDLEGHPAPKPFGDRRAMQSAENASRAEHDISRIALESHWPWPFNKHWRRRHVVRHVVTDADLIAHEAVDRSRSGSSR
jgi:hypothetical protein